MSARWWAALALAAGILLGWLLWGRGRVPEAVLIARVDTVLTAGPAVHDTLRIHLRAAQAHRDSSAERAADAERDALAADTARQAADSLALRGDLPGALAACGQRATALEQAADQWRAALLQCGLATAAADSGRALALRRADTLEALLGAAGGALRRARPAPRWAAGALWAPGRSIPVGGWLARRTGPLALLVAVTDEPQEPARLRLGVGLSW